MLVECRGSEGMNLYFRTIEPEDEDVRPENAPSVAPRWYEWWTRIYAHVEEAWEENDHDAYLRTPVYIYAAQERVGARAIRHIRIKKAAPASLDPDQRPNSFSDPLLMVPQEFCATSIDQMGQCLEK